MRRDDRRIEGVTAWDVALVQRVARGGGVAPDEWLGCAGGVDDLDGWLAEDDDEDGFDEDLPPIPCDGSVCCPCGRCDGREHPPGTDTPSRGGEQRRRPGAPASAEAVGPER